MKKETTTWGGGGNLPWRPCNDAIEGNRMGNVSCKKAWKGPPKLQGTDSLVFFGVLWRAYTSIYIKIIISIMIIIIYNICIYVYIHTLHVRVYPLILYLVFFLWGVLCFLHGSLSPSYTRFWSDEFKSPAVWRETWAKVIVVALP